MGTKRKTRLFARIRLVGTKALFTLWTAGVLAFGLLLGWIAFAEPSKIEKFGENGNWAEWIAAIATIVVGYQASVIAIDGHKYRLKADARTEKNEREARAATLVRVLMKLKKIGLVHAGITRLVGKSTTPSKGIFYFTLDRAIARLNSLLTWTESEMSCFKAEHVKAFSDFQQLVEQYRDTCKVCMEGNDPDSNEPTEAFDVAILTESVPTVDRLVIQMDQLSVDLERAWRPFLEGS